LAFSQKKVKSVDSVRPCSEHGTFDRRLFEAIVANAANTSVEEHSLELSASGRRHVLEKRDVHA